MVVVEHGRELKTRPLRAFQIAHRIAAQPKRQEAEPMRGGGRHQAPDGEASVGDVDPKPRPNRAGERAVEEEVFAGLRLATSR
jgi:hypothetical protein